MGIANDLTKGAASTSDLLSSLQHLVQAVNNAATTYLNVNGVATIANISAPTVIKSSAGRVVNMSVVTAGSTVGQLYDANALGATTGRPLIAIPNTLAPPIINVNLPVSYGILCVPGTGQQVTVSYS